MWVLVLGIFCPPLDTYKIKVRTNGKEKTFLTLSYNFWVELTACLQICVYFFL